MNTQPGMQQPPKSSSNKKWLMGCGIALVIVLLVVGGLAFWVYSKGKKLYEEWGSNPGLAATALVINASDNYEIVDKDLDAGSITVKNSNTGEVSVWTMQVFDENSDSVKFTDDKGRTITIGGSSGKPISISEPEPEPGDESDEDTAEEEASGEEEVVEDAVIDGGA